MRFGISTHLYHDQRLTRAHLGEVASYGFEAIELFATRSHFDYHDPSAIAALAGWVRETGLALHSIHAPITESFVDGKWGRSFSTASPDNADRQLAVAESQAALEIARQTGAGFMVVHLGIPKGQTPGSINNRDAARRSIVEMEAMATPLGVRIAVEVIPNDLSTPESLVSMIEDELELPGVGICLDFGHAFILGDTADAVEASAEYLITTHIHDNHRKSDDHLVPFDGAIDWPLALTALQKVGYEGTMLMELANTSSPQDVLQKAKRARERFEKLMGAAAQLRIDSEH